MRGLERKIKARRVGWGSGCSRHQPTMARVHIDDLGITRLLARRAGAPAVMLGNFHLLRDPGVSTFSHENADDDEWDRANPVRVVKTDDEWPLSRTALGPRTTASMMLHTNTLEDYGDNDALDATGGSGGSGAG